MPTIKSQILPVIIFNAVYLLAASIFALQGSNLEFLFYIVVVLVVAASLTWVYVKDGLSAPVLWAMSIWGFLHMSGGLVHIPPEWPRSKDPSVLYNLWLIPQFFKFDQFVHAYGFGTTVWLLWEILSGSILRRSPSLKAVRPTFGLMFLCAVASMGLGSLNEILEFIAVLAIPSTNVGGYDNTCWDMVFNMLGASLVAAVIYFIENRKY